MEICYPIGFALKVILNAKEIKEDYTQVNLNKWNIGDLFKSYIDNMRINMSLTVDIDVTKLKLTI